ncbi:MAG: hypothetical protein IJS90_06780 [Clostridia bacterium]|nr:hypothetical protein [Clostridia bacterium]
MDLIPQKSQITGNYFCTWDSQCDHMYARKERPKGLTARDAMNENFLFGENGVLNSFEGMRQDLIVVLDDGWDVPYGATDSRIFGSLEADPERFPSLSGLRPEERLKALSKRIESMGYRGLGLWAPTQSPYYVNGAVITRTPEEERFYWEERARWCHEAGVLYLKADWGAHQGDAQYCAMMTECMRKYAPGLSVEHGFSGRPLFEEKSPVVPEELAAYLKNVLPVSDYLRTYDVCHELKYASTVDRAAICLNAAKACRADTILNIEDTALIGAALGCAVGVMRHDLEKKRKYLPLPPRLVSESYAALRWQRIAAPFAAGKGSLIISDERLKDVWRCPKRAPGLWPNVPEGDYFVSAPASIARNMPLPEVFSEGEKPYVLCSVHPYNGALCVAVTPRTFPEGIDLAPLADIIVQGGSPEKPVGLFGRFASLRVDFGKPAENRRVYAQNLLSDTAEDVTALVGISGNRLTVPGELMLRIGTPENRENGVPAVVIKLSEA